MLYGGMQQHCLQNLQKQLTFLKLDLKLDQNIHRLIFVKKSYDLFELTNNFQIQFKHIYCKVNQI